MSLNKHPIEEEKEVLLFGTVTIVFCLIIIGAIWAPTNGITGHVVADVKTTKTIINYDFLPDNITKDFAEQAILQAEADITEMENEGFGIVFVNDTLLDARKFFEGENYTELLNQVRRIKDRIERDNAKRLVLRAQENADFFVDYNKVIEKTKVINDRKELAYELRDTLNVEYARVLNLNTTGIDFSSAIEIVRSAEVSFNEERFGEVLDLLSTLEGEIDRVQSENTLVKTVYRAGRENVTTFIKENWIDILIICSIVLVISILSYNRVRLKIYRSKIQNMRIEKDVLTELIKKAQLDYYQHHTIDKKSYDIKFNSYKDRLADIKQKLPGLIKKTKKIANLKRFL